MHWIHLLIAVVAFAAPTATLAQAQKKDVYADPQNLEVLPEDIDANELRETMKGFAMGLGVRCETCHVGEAGQPLDTFDFASDEKDMKRKARLMLKMMRDINRKYVPKLDKIDEQERVAVRCVTCHRGRPRPLLIQDELDHELATAGVDAAVERYTELREEYYGSHSYDFSEMTLPLYVQSVAARGEIDAAIAVLELNAANFPSSYYTQFVLAELHSAASNQAAALAAYEKAIELNPRAAAFLQPRIDKLQADGVE